LVKKNYKTGSFGVTEAGKKYRDSHKLKKTQRKKILKKWRNKSE
jgi:hypothetical protein